ncbi:hypothetical protein ACS5PJ_14410 [Pseudarthrobacter sp. YS3]|uniref:hypothetical protein n=1 Tax=Pseudarthrobacter sp. YS3 TaxID=3453718 RepID=UPI003EEA53A9
MSTIDPDVKQNYQDLHESTGESYESIARRVNAHGDPELASWLRSQAAGEPAHQDDQETRTTPPQGRRPAKQETAAAADAESSATADAKAKEAAAKK